MLFRKCLTSHLLKSSDRVQPCADRHGVQVGVWGHGSAGYVAGGDGDRPRGTASSLWSGVKPRRPRCARKLAVNDPHAWRFWFMSGGGKCGSYFADWVVSRLGRPVDMTPPLAQARASVLGHGHGGTLGQADRALAASAWADAPAAFAAGLATISSAPASRFDRPARRRDRSGNRRSLR